MGHSTTYTRVVNSADREAWLAARHSVQGLGASDAGTIMGLNPYESEYTLYQRLVGNIPPLEDTRHMEWGRRLEEAVTARFVEETERNVKAPNTRRTIGGWLLRSRKYPWMYATPDREIISPSGLLEVKTATQYLAEHWRDEVPPHYQAQLQHQFVVTGRVRGSICALIGGNDFVYGDFERRDRFCNALIKKTDGFWQRVVNRDEPAPDDSPSTSDTLKQMVAEGRCIELPDEVVQWHTEMEDAARDEKDAKERKEMYQRKIQAVMGKATHGVLPPFGMAGIFTFKMEHRRSFTVKATSGRRLRYSKKLKI